MMRRITFGFSRIVMVFLGMVAITHVWAGSPTDEERLSAVQRTFDQVRAEASNAKRVRPSKTNEKRLALSPTQSTRRLYFKFDEAFRVRFRHGAFVAFTSDTIEIQVRKNLEAISDLVNFEPSGKTLRIKAHRGKVWVDFRGPST